MSAVSNRPQPDPIIAHMLDQLVSLEAVQSNCMFQLALMLARISLEPCTDAYKEETVQALLGLIRDKPKTNVVNLFGLAPGRGGDSVSRPSTPL